MAMDSRRGRISCAGSMRAAHSCRETSFMTCDDCDGRGEVLDAPSDVLSGRTYWTPCPTCGGSGQLSPRAEVADSTTVEGEEVSENIDDS